MDNSDAVKIRTYHPLLLPRRGEVIAWLCALMCIFAWVILDWAQSPVFIGLQILAVVLIFIAAAISLSNWVDRHTALQINASGITFENGLRKAAMDWKSIRKVEVVDTPWGKKVQVLGDNTHFDFRTLAEVILNGELKGQMGFVDGDQILKEIIQKASLKEISSDEVGRVFYAPK